MSTSNEQEREERAGRLPSLEEQTPGLDSAQVKRTDEDAVAYYSRDEGQGTTDLDTMADAAGRGEGADEGKPPSGDVRTVYENERQPGEAQPRGE